MEKKMETIMIYWGDIGIMEKKMETTMVYWGDIGIMEKKIETTIGSLRGLGAPSAFTQRVLTVILLVGLGVGCPHPLIVTTMDNGNQIRVPIYS